MYTLLTGVRKSPMSEESRDDQGHPRPIALVPVVTERASARKEAIALRSA